LVSSSLLELYAGDQKLSRKKHGFIVENRLANSSDKPALAAWFPNVMVYSRCVKSVLFFPILLLFYANIGGAQSTAPATPAAGNADYSGMYSFLKDGEFIQITIEDGGKVSGFISRFGDSETNKGTFLDQFLKSGNSEGIKLSFTTENVHGVWFTFEGAFSRGPGKRTDEEGYYVLRGTLTRFSVGADSKTVSQAREVEFKSFPRDPAPGE